MLAAAAVRVLLFQLRGAYTDWDETMYLLLARSLMEGEGFRLNGLPHSALGPGVPLLTAALGAVTGLAPLAAQRALSVAAGGLLLVPVWYLARRHGGERVAWTAAALLVAWPALVDVAPKAGPMWSHFYAGTEPTHLFLLLAAIAAGEWALARSGPRTWAGGFGAGALMAGAYAARSETVVFAGLYLVLRAVRLTRPAGTAGTAGTAGAGPALPALASAVAGFFLVASPYLLHLHGATGSWTLSGQPASMGPAAETLQEVFKSDAGFPAYLGTWHVPEPGHRYMQNPYWGTPEDVPRARQAAGYATVAAARTPVDRSRSGRAIDRVANYGRVLWTLTGLLFAPFVALGIWTTRRRELPTLAVAAFAASLVVSLALAAVPRFFLYLVPVLAVWAAHGVLALADRAPATLRPRALPALAAVLVAVSVATVVPTAVGGVARGFREAAVVDRAVAERLAGALPSGATVMHAHPRFAYWGGWTWRIMPYAPLDVVAHYAAERGTRHLLLSQAGYSPLNVEVSHLLLTLDEAARSALAALDPAPDGGHAHPPLDLREVAPVADVAAGVIELSVAPPEG